MKLSSQNTIIIIGAVLGAVLGGLGGWAYLEARQNGGLFTTKKEGGREMVVKAGPADFFRIGMAVWALVRMVQGLVKPK